MRPCKAAGGGGTPAAAAAQAPASHLQLTSVTGRRWLLHPAALPPAWAAGRARQLKLIPPACRSGGFAAINWRPARAGERPASGRRQRHSPGWPLLRLLERKQVRHKVTTTRGAPPTRLWFRCALPAMIAAALAAPAAAQRQGGPRLPHRGPGAAPLRCHRLPATAARRGGARRTSTRCQVRDLRAKTVRLPSPSHAPPAPPIAAATHQDRGAAGGAAAGRRRRAAGGGGGARLAAVPARPVSAPMAWLLRGRQAACEAAPLLDSPSPCRCTPTGSPPRAAPAAPAGGTGWPQSMAAPRQRWIPTTSPRRRTASASWRTPSPSLRRGCRPWGSGAQRVLCSLALLALALRMPPTAVRCHPLRPPPPGRSKGERVSLFSENSGRWLVADQAIMKCGGADAVRRSRLRSPPDAVLPPACSHSWHCRSHCL